MAEWSNATMTDVGADLQAKVNAGKTKLTFTKIKVGSGVNATNPSALTNVISSKWETTNFVVKREGKIVSVDTFITNAGIHEAFRMSEIGLFAQDPDKGEILYAYLTDPEPDRMPAEGGSVVVSQELTIGMIFSNTGNVSLTVNMGALVTHEQLTEAVKQHNTDAHAHDNRFKALEQTTNKKYDKSGGVLNGDIILSGDSKIKTDGSGFDLTILGGSEESNGAYITLNGNGYPDNSNGEFCIASSGNGAKRELIGNLDGTLKWDGDEIIRKSMLATKDDTSALSQAPTLQLVKSLLSGLNIKSGQDVLQALGTETLQSLGVKYDFSNESAWYICLGRLFGGLIIQGGMYYSAYDGSMTTTFPIAFNQKCFFVIKNPCNTYNNNNVLYREWVLYNVTTTSFTTNYCVPRSDVYYVTMGL